MGLGRPREAERPVGELNRPELGRHTDDGTHASVSFSRREYIRSIYKETRLAANEEQYNFRMTRINIAM